MLTPHASEMHISRQQYTDGYIYEYQMPRGMLLNPRNAYYAIPFFSARVLRTYEEGNFAYVSVWVSDEESLVYDRAYREAADLPDTAYDAGPLGEPEELHVGDHVRVARERYKTGWVYLVEVPLGLPWPSSHAVPCLTPTRIAPVIAIEPAGSSFVAKFWVADGPNVPRAVVSKN
ncbi:hypothetical protein ACTMTF_15295 [Nonomuraea sp. ZG12]|uniref:hypothetical protein n=1 Tax=Nonomuraea sp. ZG12 TaxID=3452207 RepID=UPI003F88B212